MPSDERGPRDNVDDPLLTERGGDAQQMCADVRCYKYERFVCGSHVEVGVSSRFSSLWPLVSPPAAGAWLPS